MTKTLARLAALAVTLQAATLPARAQDAAEFYRGKTVRFVVGVGVGGGFDAYARMIAPHLAKELGANVIVENVLGAGGLLSLNQTYSAQPDGLRLLIVNGTPAGLGQLLGQDNLRYDLTKFAHLGIIAAYPWMWVAGLKSGIGKVADAKARDGKPKTVRWGGTGPSDGPADGAATTCEALQLDCRIVLGYKGSAEIALAMERGETDSLYVSDSSAAAYVQGGQAVAVASMGRVRSPLLADTPTVFEQASLSPEQEWLLDFRANLNDLGRILVTTPGVPADRLAFLRGAVQRALTSPELITEGEKTQRFIAFQSAGRALEIANKALTSAAPDKIVRMRDIIFNRQ